MADVGKLTLGVVWDGRRVRAAEIRSTRPMVTEVLKGKTAAQVQRMVPMLFGVCGRAQGAAARAAIHAAVQAAEHDVIAAEREIACEAMQEHLWRLLLDWPALLGMPRQERQFTQWHKMLGRIATGEQKMADFARDFERKELGMPPAAWREIGRFETLQTWWCNADTFLARLLAKLAATDRLGSPAFNMKLLPPWSAGDAARACAGRWSAAFAARPDWQGAAAETGAWTYYSDHPLLCDAGQRGAKALPRMLARILDLAGMASDDPAPRLDAVAPAEGEGIAVAHTARGLLIHRATFDGEHVADYSIIAPTEWNFHPAGAFAQELVGTEAGSEEALKSCAHAAALSLDPCVAYEIEVRHA